MTTAVAPRQPTGSPAPQPPRPSVQRLRSEIDRLLRGTRAVVRASGTPIDLDLPQPTYAVLRQLVVLRRGYVNEIAVALGMERTEVRDHLDELERLGLVARIRDVRNPGRMVRVLTLMGRRVGDGSHAATRVLETRVAGWTEEDVETLARLLARLNGPADL